MRKVCFSKTDPTKEHPRNPPLVLFADDGSSEDHLHDAGRAGHGPGGPERRAAGKGAAVGGVEERPRGREVPV